jgi:hypothetical protein
MFDAHNEAPEPYAFIQGKVDEVNTQLQAYFTNLGSTSPTASGNGVPETWVDKIEDALRHMILILLDGKPQIGP